MELGVGERLALKNILPPAGDLGKMRQVHTVYRLLNFSDEENKAYNIRVEQVNPGQSTIHWDPEVPPADILFDPLSFKLILDSFEKIAAAGELTLDLLSIYEKFLDVIDGTKKE
jgi:hypothetical protein